MIIDRKQIVIADTLSELELGLTTPNTLVILSGGPYSLPRQINVASGVVAMSLDSWRAQIMGHGLMIKNVRNVHVENIDFSDVKGDCITIRRSTDVTIRSCSFTRASDGLLDINGGSKAKIEKCHFFSDPDETQRGCLIGNWQEPDDPPEEVFMIGNEFSGVSVRCPKVDGASVFLKHHTVGGYRQYAVDVRAGSTVHIHHLEDRGGPKAHEPVKVHDGADVVYLDKEG